MPVLLGRRRLTRQSLIQLLNQLANKTGVIVTGNEVWDRLTEVAESNKVSGEQFIDDLEAQGVSRISVMTFDSRIDIER